MPRQDQSARAPALKRALRAVREQLELARETTDGRLPSVRRLARIADVSHVTMLRALELLRNEGRLIIKQGSGCYSSEKRGKPTRPSASGPKWYRTSQAIALDIASGRFAARETLPEAKSLLDIYGVSHRTLARALNRLCDEGILERDRTRLRVTSSITGKRGIVLICAAGDDEGNIALLSPRTFSLLEALRIECDRMGADAAMIVLERRFRFRPNLENVEARLVEASRREMILGGILVQTVLPPPAVRSAVRWFEEHKRPLAVLDEDGEGGPLPSGSSFTRVFSMARPLRAGNDIGMFARSIGHSRIAYLSPYHEARWSVQRLAGLKAAFGAEAQDAVTAHTAVDPNALDSLWQPLNPTKSEMEALAARAVSKLALSPSSQTILTDDLLRVIRTHRQRLLLRQVLSVQLKSILEADRYSLIVAGNDPVAIACLEMLREMRVAVPDEMAVIGFDDSPEAHAARLTSYNFGLQNAARALVNHVLGPRPHGPNPAPVDISGIVSERASTARRATTGARPRER